MYGVTLAVFIFNIYFLLYKKVSRPSAVTPMSNHVIVFPTVYQCLPLMEYMAAGTPAIAPYSTALQDYITDLNSFLVSTGAAPTNWQHDERIGAENLY